MTGAEGTTGAEKGAKETGEEATKNGVRDESLMVKYVRWPFQ